MGYGLTMLFICCQLVLEVQDKLQCLAKQLNPFLGQTRVQKFSGLTWAKKSCSCPPVPRRARLCLSTTSQGAVRVLCSSGRTLRLPPHHVPSSGKSSFRNVAIWLHRSSCGMVPCGSWEVFVSTTYLCTKSSCITHALFIFFYLGLLPLFTSGKGELFIYPWP